MNRRIRCSISVATTIRVGVATALLAAIAPQARAADVSTSPGRAVVFETRHLTNVAINLASVTGQILKAKPKQVLTITTSVKSQLANSAQQHLVAIAKVNGVPLQAPGSYNTNCPLGNVCSVSGQWILDLDQLEAANPGTVIGQPLDVEVYTVDGYTNMAELLDLSMIARMERKK